MAEPIQVAIPSDPCQRRVADRLHHKYISQSSNRCKVYKNKQWIEHQLEQKYNIHCLTHKNESRLIRNKGIDIIKLTNINTIHRHPRPMRTSNNRYQLFRHNRHQVNHPFPNLDYRFKSTLPKLASDNSTTSLKS